MDKEELLEGLSQLETELIALKDEINILKIIPPENPPPVYLVKGVFEH